ncbi:hypothetical protein TNCV_3111 [Trichonephila clavipes]|nr:hypothetical protein TNCV_3111 [Trichonephila clavipes]
MPTSAIKDLLKKWEDVRAMVLEWHPYQADKEGKEGKSEEGEGEKKEGGEEGEKKEGGEEGEKKEGEKSGAMSFVTTFLNSRGAAVCSGCLAEMKFNMHIL